MTLIDAQPPKPPSLIRKYGPVLAAIIMAIACLLAYRLRDYPEERATTRFLAALEQGNYQEAYRLWQPSPSYTFDDFMHDWGEQGDYGRIRDFQLLESRSKGPNTVVITVRINHIDPPLDLLVDRNTKGLAFSPF
jgi:hypothetical protein